MVVGGPCDFSVSPWSKSFFFPFGGTFIQLGDLLGQGLGLGPGLESKILYFNILFQTSFFPELKSII